MDIFKKGEIVLYEPDSSIQLEVRMENETVWLNRQQMAILFGRDVKTIGKHIKNALREELAGLSTVAKNATVQKEGNRVVTREIEHFFDAYTFAADLIKSAKRRIALMDNDIDESVLLMLSKRRDGVGALIVTRRITETLQLDLERHRKQYPPIEVQERADFHDRFLILDDTVYHLGASLKDLGKKLFAFSRMEVAAEELEGRM